MRRAVTLLALVLIAFLITSNSSRAAELVRGLVVDRSDENTIWLGLPVPAHKGDVFEVRIMPEGGVVAQAEVVEATIDAPYIAKARFKLLDKTAFVAVGSYVQQIDHPIPDTDTGSRYQSVSLGPKGKNPLSFEAGILYITDSQLRRETRSVWPAFQLSYRICSSKKMDTDIAVGYYHRTGNFTENGLSGSRDFRVVPVTIDWKMWMSRSAGYGSFFDAGVGAYFINDKRAVGSVPDNSKVGTLGWQAGFGYESKRGQSARLYYTSASRRSFRGLGFVLGSRF